jgi:hypothetical protein
MGETMLLTEALVTAKKRFKKKIGSPVWQPYDASQGARKKKDGDCTVRALSAARDIPYAQAFDVIYRLMGKHRSICIRLPEFLDSDKEVLGVIRKISFPAQRGQDRMTAVQFAKRFPQGRYILQLAHHVAAMVDGVLLDVWDCSGKCVYTAWEIRPGELGFKR